MNIKILVTDAGGVYQYIRSVSSNFRSRKYVCVYWLVCVTIPWLNEKR